MKQEFLIRAEHTNDPLVSEEIRLDLYDVLTMIKILFVQKRDMRLGKKLVFLLKESNTNATKYLRDLGVKDEKTRF
jgi:hypothetical protein